MKILNLEQIRAADAYTIENEPIGSIDLMERAAWAFVRWLVKHYPPPQPLIHIVAATGNNGGDGLCIGRILAIYNYKVQISIVRLSQSSADFDYNENLLKKTLYEAIFCENINNIEDLSIRPDSLVIDALLGSGLRRPLLGLVGKVVEKINNSPCTVIAIDMPSGLYADQTSVGTAFSSIIHAHHTVSFELPKLAFMLPENYLFVGQWHVVSIGLHKDFIAQQDTNYYYFTDKDAQQRQKLIPKFAHKGTRGHVLVVGGSYGKIGAASMTAKASLKSGAGLTTVYIPYCGYNALQTIVPEAMVITPLKSNVVEHLSVTTVSTMSILQPYQVIALGPGMGMHIDTQNLVKECLMAATSQNIRLVIDADALNIIAVNQWQSLLPAGSILTPHPKEFERMTEVTSNHFARLEKLRYYAQQWQCYIVLKGAHTATSCPDGRIFFNSTGNPAMATGGSGDILTGIIAAYLAQGYSAEDSALLGIFRHGQAGDKAAAQSSNSTISAWDIINNI